MVPLLLCSLLVVVPLVSLRNSHTPSRSISLSAGAVASSRSTSARASRSRAWSARPDGDAVAAVPETSTTATPPTTVKAITVAFRAPTTTAKPVAKSTPTTVKRSPTTTSPPVSSGNSQSGKASWYDQAPTGTCAHRTLPMGTIVTVTNVSNGKSVTCRVADRGPFVDGWIIDLAKDTFAQIAPTSSGVISVRITW